MTETSLITSSVKRAQQKKQEKIQRRDYLREKLPVLSKHEITRCRLNFHEALFIELDEDGSVGTALFVHELLEFQDQLRIQHGPDSLVWTRPQLKDKKKILEKLCHDLQKAEQFHQEGNIPKETIELIKIGVNFGFNHPSKENPNADWHWLSEQIFIQAIRSSFECTTDGGRADALANYMYGKFIVEKLGDMSLAKDYLDRSRYLSAGTNWHPRKDMPPMIEEKQDSIFAESCILLHKILLTQAKTIVMFDPVQASKLCALSRKRALDACYKLGQAEALAQLGTCLMLANDPRGALSAFMKSYRYNIQVNNIIGICDALINVAMAYSKLGKKGEAEHEFEKLLALAEENNLLYYKGQANRFLGEYHLMQGNPTAATPVLLLALEIFHILNKHRSMEQTRNLASIAQGQELIEKYISLILKCSRKSDGEQNLAKLLAWKDRREPFWYEIVSPTVSQTMFSYDFSNRRSLLFPSDIYTFEKYCKMHEAADTSDHILTKVFDEDEKDDDKIGDLSETALNEDLARIASYFGEYDEYAMEEMMVEHDEMEIPMEYGMGVSQGSFSEAQDVNVSISFIMAKHSNTDTTADHLSGSVAVNSLEFESTDEQAEIIDPLTPPPSEATNNNQQI